MTTDTLAQARRQELDANDRAEMVDALYRFGAGQDLGDRALFESALAPNSGLTSKGADAWTCVAGVEGAMETIWCVRLRIGR